MSKSKTAFQFSTDTLGKELLYMWTFTFREILSIKDTRARWNYLLTLMRRRWPNLRGLRVFELHKSHGLHVHLLTNRFIDVHEARKLAQQAGWGRIHVIRMPIERAGYVGKYLSKDRPPCFKRWRLWAGFGRWDWTRVKDLAVTSLFSQIYKACQTWLAWKGKTGFFDRMRLVAHLEFRTICEGWQPGFGPNGKSFSACTRADLLGFPPQDSMERHVPEPNSAGTTA
jgi:hypothetical protein